MEFVIVTGPTYKEAIKTVKKAVKISDGIEFRIDLFQSIFPLELTELVKICHFHEKKVLFTIRSCAQGGGSSLSKDSLENYIQELCSLSPDYIDIEYTLSKKLTSSITNVKKIISYHNFEKTPSNLEETLMLLQEHSAHAYKICTTARDISDAYRMMNFVHKQKKKGVNIIGLCMGKDGVTTRTDGLKFGNYLNYKIIHVRDNVARGLNFA